MGQFRILSIWSILVVLLLTGTGIASAHQDQPLKSLKLQAGPYPLIVNYYSEPRGGQALLFEIVPVGGLSGPVEYQIVAVPGTLVNAVPVNAALSPDAEHPGGVRGSVNLPVSGQWLLAIDLKGERGKGAVDAPILAGTPPVIPAWLGWLIGLIPAWAMLGLIVSRAWALPLARRAETPLAR